MDDETVGFLIIDDTLSEKDTSTKNIEGLEFHRSHSKNKAVWSHCVVSSHYKVSDYSLPLNVKLYLRKQFFGKRAKKYFKNKQQLAIELIDKFVPVTDVTYLLIDAWYTEGEDTYYVYRYEGKINDVQNVIILFSWTEPDLSDTPTFIVCTDISATASLILDYYLKRWDIEVSYRYHKNSFSFDEYQVELLTSIKRFFSMVFMSYTFLELFRVSNKKTLKLNTVGDTVRYFRQQHMVSIVKYAYTCAKNNVSIGITVANLGIAA